MKGSIFLKFSFVHLSGVILFVFSYSMGYGQDAGREPRPLLDYKIQLDVVSSGYNGIDNWFHPHGRKW